MTFLFNSQRRGCIIIDEEGIQVLEGNRTTDNCYGAVPTAPISHKSARVDMLELWHQRFGHANFKQVAKVSNLRRLKDFQNLERLRKPFVVHVKWGSKQRQVIKRGM